MKDYGPINKKCPHMLHGGDYNPDQWRHMPGIIDEDMRLMRLAGCNAMSVGIFAWSALEPEEGRFEFGWLDDVMDKLAENDAYAVLATPSGARPAWLSFKYPDVLRVRPDRGRNLHGRRHNHCYTSTVYREKVAEIDRRLAERYKDHPALLVWHLSNEYGGECHCPLCQEAFREWLKVRYEGDLDRLNKAWWTGFWSHTYTKWSQIESPSQFGETAVHGLNIDWKRFVTDQTADFFRHEVSVLREVTPDVPVTTNLMGTYPGLNYWKLAPIADVISWDSYPCWHGRGTVVNPRGQWDKEGRDWMIAADASFAHDINRSLKDGKPFMLMESTPSMTNWMSVSKLKRPGMHIASSINAVAHGSDTVQYFQWRKSRGSSEKFHGAVVDHEGTENTRVFREVAELGEILGKLDDVVGSGVPARAAIIFDWENRWAIEDAQGPRNDDRKAYEETCKRHYYPFWRMGIPVDVIDSEGDFLQYDLVVAPMLYMVRDGAGRRITEFVRRGGTLVATYWSGIVDGNDLCFLGGFPGPLRKVLGIRSEEIDALYPEDSNRVVVGPAAVLGCPSTGGKALEITGEYTIRDLCDLIHLEGAESLAEYKYDFYAGRPALTANKFGEGHAYYIAARMEDGFLMDFYRSVSGLTGLRKALPTDPPEGVSAKLRSDGVSDFLFLINFTPESEFVRTGPNQWTDVLNGGAAADPVGLPPYGVAVLKRPRNR
jgi:beta-galactosidase